jgi:hypothetical protein
MFVRNLEIQFRSHAENLPDKFSDLLGIGLAFGPTRQKMAQ